MNVHLLIVDPQNDFMGEADGKPYVFNIGSRKFEAALPVPGALSDMRRIATLIDRIGDKIKSIYVTVCAHHRIDIGHPGFWRNDKGESPLPFTLITKADIVNSVWYPRNTAMRHHMIEYADALETNSQYRITVWREHCLIGGPGGLVQVDLAEALERWERATGTNAGYMVKGTNPYREHYGALMAEVPDPSDPGTMLNEVFLEGLRNVDPSDTIAVCGEAETHCTLVTVKQIAEHIGDEHLTKFRILTDCMSPIPAVADSPDYPQISKQFFAQMADRGMKLTTSTELV